MRRLIPPLLLVLLALPAGAAAKEGAALSPALSALKPGSAADVRVYVFVGPARARPVVVLRPRGGGRELRFPASAKDIARVTVPGPAGRRWTVWVLARGHRYPVEMQPSFVAGADYAGSLQTDPAPPATAEASGTPAWPFVLAAALALTSLGAWRWRRAGRTA